MSVLSNNALNPLGAPWRIDKYGYVYRSDGGLIGSIRRGDFKTPDVVVQWLCGAAEVASALYPLSLEATSHIKAIGRGLVDLTDALNAAMNAGAPALSHLCETSGRAPRWWEVCERYTVSARTKVVYDDLNYLLLHEEWKHRLGWDQRSSLGRKLLKADGLLDDFKVHGQRSTGHWDGTSLLYSAGSDKVLFQTDRRTLDESYPQATPLFCKFLRRILHQGRADNPLAPPEILKQLADAITVMKTNFGSLESVLDACIHMSDCDVVSLVKAKNKLKKLMNAVDASRQGVRIEDVLAMSPTDRTAYYGRIRREDIKWEASAWQFALLLPE